MVRSSAILFALALLVLLVLIAPAKTALAHAEPERADPPINGIVTRAPAQLEVWFSEEVDTAETTLTVRGPDGAVVDQGDTTVDLMDPNHQHVTLSLKPGLGPGTYVVEWHTLSVTDGDAADGFFSFAIAGGTPVASPGASPVASPIGSPVATPADVPSPTPTVALVAISTVAPTATTDNDTGSTEDFDSQAFAISVGAGLVAAAFIYLFWRFVRPKRTG